MTREFDEQVGARRGLKNELTSLLNSYSVERGSNTPDHVLANYMLDCLIAYERAIAARTKLGSTHTVPHIVEYNQTAMDNVPDITTWATKS